MEDTDPETKLNHDELVEGKQNTSQIQDTDVHMQTSTDQVTLEEPITAYQNDPDDPTKGIERLDSEQNETGEKDPPETDGFVTSQADVSMTVLTDNPDQSPQAECVKPEELSLGDSPTSVTDESLQRPRRNVEEDVVKITEEKWPEVNGVYDPEGQWHDWNDITYSYSYDKTELIILPYTVCIIELHGGSEQYVAESTGS